MRLEVELVRVALRAPIPAAHGELHERDLLHVTLTGPDGATGHGEAAPLQSYDGVSVAEVRRALADAADALAGAPPDASRAELLAAATRAAVLPQAAAAVDLALWDLEGRRHTQPVWQLLGANAPRPVELNATIGALDRAGAAAAAGAARAANFATVKVKVGVGDDAGRVAAVRAAAGPQMALRLDANGAWGVEEALAALRALGPVGIECCEEPCAGLEANAQVAALSTVPIALDESARLPGALQTRQAEAVCLKVASGGGITGVIAAARRARAVGYEVYLASTYDGPLGIAAALHAATVIGPERACGLATLDAFARESPLPPDRGRLKAPSGPGLGEHLLDWYRG